MAFTANRFPVMVFHKFDCCWNGQGRSGIFGARPLQDVDEARARRRLWCWMRTPAYDQRFHKLLSVASYKEKRCTFWRHHPFMTVAKSDICAQLLQVKRHLSRRMRRIDDRYDACLPRPSPDLLHWQTKRCCRG